MQVVPTNKPLGAEIRGIKISSDLSEQELAGIRQALDDHSVVFFRDQELDEATHVAFSKRLGSLRVPRLNSKALVPGWPDLTVLSNIIENGEPIGLLEAGQYWHSDNCFKQVPNSYALLYAQEIPQQHGKMLGGTMFASALHAYETLDGEMRQRIAGRKSRNNFQNPFRRKALSADAAKIYWEEKQEPDSVHPIVRTHPRTGRKGLYVNETYTVGVDAMEQAQSREIIDFLCNHITRPEAIYTHEWHVGDFLIWDDCASQHNAIADYQLPLRRKLRRTTVQGTTPF